MSALCASPSRLADLLSGASVQHSSTVGNVNAGEPNAPVPQECEVIGPGLHPREIANSCPWRAAKPASALTGACASRHEESELGQDVTWLTPGSVRRRTGAAREERFYVQLHVQQTRERRDEPQDTRQF